MNRDDIVDSALDKINGDRQDEYGDVLNSFTTISIGWDTIVKAALGSHGCITPMHVGLMMDWLKTSRLLVDINHADSWVDKVGYAALSAEVADRYMEPGELLDIRWGTGRVSPDAQPEEDKNGNNAVIAQNIQPKKENSDDWVQDFAERMSKAGMTDEDVAEYISGEGTGTNKPITRAQLAAELEPGLNALFGTEYDPYVEPKTCQKIDGRNGKPCGLPLVGRQKKFCSKHVPKSTKVARKAYGERSKRQVNDQLS